MRLSLRTRGPAALRTMRRKRMVAVVPSLLTLGNAVCGFTCITCAAKVGPEVGADVTSLHFAALMIFAAMVFDALDGPVARLARQTSEFGAQLDSLADAISFGVAPAFLMLKFSDNVFHPRLLWVIATLYMLCAVLRLARFNVTQASDPSHETFCGLPSPAAAGMVASMVLVQRGLLQLAGSDPTHPREQAAQFLSWFTEASLPVVTLIVACLMVSRIRYPHLVNQWFHGRHNFQHLVKLLFALVAVLAVHELAIPLVLLCFAVSSPLRAFWVRVILRQRPAPAVPPPEVPEVPPDQAASAAP